MSPSNTIESKVEQLLTSMGYEFDAQVRIGRYSVDFLVRGKYIVECYGDFWHCNPEQYTSSYFNRGKKKTAKEIWERDQKRKDEFEKMGYIFICLWESEIRNAPKVVRRRLKRIITSVDKAEPT